MVQNAEIITTAARRGDWRAAAWFLEHRRPDQWSDVAKRWQDSPDEEMRLKAQYWDEHVERKREEEHKEMEAILKSDPKRYGANYATLTIIEAREKLRAKIERRRREQREIDVQTGE